MDLDYTSFSDFTGFPMALYSNQLHLPFQSSRGCIWKCKFCSSCNVWPGYAQMSGDRMFAEIMCQKRLLPGKYHVEFYDLLANGDISSLSRFTELILDDQKINSGKNFFGWKINAVIRPEMTPDLLSKMRKANCKDIIYGLESGSQKILDLMGKKYDPGVALRVLADSRKAGIHTTANFMFGFPGETEEDFSHTLGILRSAAPSLDRVYASATFTSLEEGSYLTANKHEFGIRETGPDRFHNLYWETEDGANDYLVRLERYTRFRAQAEALGLYAYKGVQGNLEQERLSALGQFYRYKGLHLKAINCLLDALDLNPDNDALSAELAPYYQDLRKLLLVRENLLKLARNPGKRPRLTEAIRKDLASMRDKAELTGENTLLWMGTPVPEPAGLRRTCRKAYRILEAARGTPPPPPQPASNGNAADRRRGAAETNAADNARESHAGRAVLSTTPRKIFLQIDAPCNADCVFCSRNEKYAYFDFREYRRRIHPGIFAILRRAEELLFTGSGELLLLPEAGQIISYFNSEYPQAAKQLATNASHRERRLWELFCRPGDRYTLQISLHAGSAAVHRRVTGLDAYDTIMENLSFLCAHRAKHGWPRINLMFVMTSANFEDLPEFVRLGGRLGVDKLIANHAYIYRPDQAQLSLHSRRAGTNAVLAEAMSLAAGLKLNVSFPPLFTDGTGKSLPPGECREPWSQIMINSAGDVLPCDLSGEFRQNLIRDGFWHIWNGPAYQDCRRKILSRTGCYSKCPRHNPASLDIIDSLTISRPSPETHKNGNGGASEQ
jgi:MoaA/NifB/PqqE/SkfB family radical SAM enzyme